MSGSEDDAELVVTPRPASDRRLMALANRFVIAVAKATAGYQSAAGGVFTRWAR
jgi:hypothetical protein